MASPSRSPRAASRRVRRRSHGASRRARVFRPTSCSASSSGRREIAVEPFGATLRIRIEVVVEMHAVDVVSLHDVEHDAHRLRPARPARRDPSRAACRTSSRVPDDAARCASPRAAPSRDGSFARYGLNHACSSSPRACACSTANCERIPERRGRHALPSREVLRPRLDLRRVQRVARRPHLEDDGVQPERRRAIEQRDAVRPSRATAAAPASTASRGCARSRPTRRGTRARPPAERTHCRSADTGSRRLRRRMPVRYPAATRARVDAPAQAAETATRSRGRSAAASPQAADIRRDFLGLGSRSKDELQLARRYPRNTPLPDATRRTPSVFIPAISSRSTVNPQAALMRVELAGFATSPVNVVSNCRRTARDRRRVARGVDAHEHEMHARALRTRAVHGRAPSRSASSGTRPGSACNRNTRTSARPVCAARSNARPSTSMRCSAGAACGSGDDGPVFGRSSRARDGRHRGQRRPGRCERGAQSPS